MLSGAGNARLIRSLYQENVCFFQKSLESDQGVNITGERTYSGGAVSADFALASST